MIDNFVYWLTDPEFAPLNDSDYDLIVMETGVTSGAAVLSTNQLEELQGQDTADTSDDRPVLGYVNIAVTDHNRTYWADVAQYVTPFDPSNADYGTVSPSAPAWLRDPLGLATGPWTEGEPQYDGYYPDETIYGPIVDFVSETPDAGGGWQTGSWHAIVVEQAEAVIQSGYAGVFLDDVSRYYIDDVEINGHSVAERAEAMVAFVNDVADAVHAINPDAYIAINTDAYITWVNGDDVTDEEAAFLENVDFVILENQFDNAPYALLEAATVWEGHAQVLSIEWQDTLEAPGAYAAFIAEHGIISHIPDDAAYDDFTPIPTAPAPDPEYTLIIGTWRDERIDGTAGPDRIYGLDGDDTIYGHGGDDTIYGGEGADFLAISPAPVPTLSASADHCGKPMLADKGPDLPAPEPWDDFLL